AADAKRKADEKARLVVELGREATAEDAAIAEINRQIGELIEKRTAHEEKRNGALYRIEKGRPIVAKLQDEAQVLLEAAKQLPDPSPRIAGLRGQLAAVESRQAASIKRQQASEQLARLAHEKEHAEAEHAKLDLALTRLRDLRQNLLNDRSIGVPGLQIEAGELRLDGVSFKQASQAQKINVACALAFRRNSALKILRLDDAEHLDGANRELLLSLADRYGYQCFLTFVRDTDGLQVEIVEARR
ncbi:MAG: hypothetical protein L0211_11060, partial [Planctomycetaceae bacterium]|nr:hypothetical protein [Planctomycetaceae bacterium]